MDIKINGQAHTIPNTIQNLSDLLSHLHISSKGRIIEQNTTLIKEGQFLDTPIKNDDVIEIIQFMGGG